MKSIPISSHFHSGIYNSASFYPLANITHCPM
jgi:hypothetical protein